MQLAERDPDFAAAFEACGLPPKRQQPLGFEGLLSIILAQQVSAGATRAIRDRLYTAVGKLTPETFLALDDEALRGIGFSRQKVRYGRGIAEVTQSGELDFDAVAAMDDGAAIAELCKIKGIGPWTAEVYLLFSLGRPDVWPAADLAVQEALKRLKRLRKRPSTERMRKLGQAWRPHRSAAARFLWHYYSHPGV
jgi:DNA-3-methyladenine glycosylase II